MTFLKNLLALAVPVLLFACRKEGFTTNAGARLQTNVDTLHFDTVFTTAGSVTRLLKIVNTNNKGIRLTSVRLAGGAASPFKINADGAPGPQVSDVDVPANDSVYVYVTISVNPTAQNLPFLTRDSIELAYNGNRQWVQLDAFGQNAHFYRNRRITANEVWNNDLPYVILGRLTVDTTATLTINKGCKIYLHADAPFIVNGSLQVAGEKYDSTRVIFSGDRLDDPYKDYPAAYPGIIFTASSKGNSISYGVIKNAYQGITVLDPAPSGAKLTLNETIIDNAYSNGLSGINTSISARNVLISNCGQNLALGGGTYDFRHCTIASYSTGFVPHKEPVFILTNYSVQGNTIFTSALNAAFTNCIFFGEQNGFVNNEVTIDLKGSGTPAISFNRVLWRVQTPPSGTGITINGTPVNQPPVFDSINTAQRFFNFRLKDGSPAVNAGTGAGIALDLDGRPRPVGLPDLGAYEKQ